MIYLLIKNKVNDKKRFKNTHTIDMNLINIIVKYIKQIYIFYYTWSM